MRLYIQAKFHHFGVMTYNKYSVVIEKWKPQYLLKERITFKDHLWLEMNVYAYDFTTRFGIKTFGIELFRRQIYHYQSTKTTKSILSNYLLSNFADIGYWFFFLRIDDLQFISYISFHFIHKSTKIYSFEMFSVLFQITRKQL